MKSPKLILFLVIGLAVLIISSMIFFNIKPEVIKKEDVPQITKTPTPLPTPYDNLPAEKKLELQTTADNNYANIQDDLLKQYPWYSSMPLQTENYFAYFNLDKKVFIGKIYPQRSSAVTVEDQVTAYQNEIKNKLQSLKIDLSVYNIEWIVTPE